MDPTTLVPALISLIDRAQPEWKKEVVPLSVEV
jgi:hypothetical protein